MASEIETRSEITVRLVASVGGDHSVVAAAKVSVSGEDALVWADPAKADDAAGLIDYLMRHRHGTPFEHSSLTFFVHAPAFVWWEWVRHRVGMTVDCPEFSFNLESSRYRELNPVFWVPRENRPMTPAPDHKPARPKFWTLTEAFQHAAGSRYSELMDQMRTAYAAAWSSYQRMIGRGIANEVARAVLPFAVYFSGWVTANPRSLMHFISLRTHDPAAKFVSYPQLEIEEAARACEAVLAEGWPVTHAAFVRHGRVAP